MFYFKVEVDRFLCCKAWDIINILIDAFLDIGLLFGYTWGVSTRVSLISLSLYVFTTRSCN